MSAKLPANRPLRWIALVDAEDTLALPFVQGKRRFGTQEKLLAQRSLLKSWLRGLDLNQRPSGYEPDELPGCSTPHDESSWVARFLQIKNRPTTQTRLSFAASRLR